MNSYFENKIEEIEQIITKSRKDHAVSILKIQKAKELTLNIKNQQILKSDVEVIEGANIQMITKHGYMVSGTSDRLHLPDVLTRLYQEIENLSKANKGHKVPGNFSFLDLPTEQYANVENLDLSDFDQEYFKSIINEIYANVPLAQRQLVDMEFQLKGFYALWLIANSLKGIVEFDEYSMSLDINICDKKDSFNDISVKILIPAYNIRTKKIDAKLISTDIQKAIKLILNKKRALTSKTITSLDAIIADGYLSTQITVHAVEAGDASKIDENLVVNTIENASLTTEYFDKLGVKVIEKKASEKHQLWRQKYFYTNVFSVPINVFLPTREKDTTDSQYFNFEEIAKESNFKSYLLISGEYLFDKERSVSIISVDHAVLYEEGNAKLVNIDFIVLKSPANLTFIGSTEKCLINKSNISITALIPKIGVKDMSVIENFV